MVAEYHSNLQDHVLNSIFVIPSFHGCYVTTTYQLNKYGMLVNDICRHNHFAKVIMGSLYHAPSPPPPPFWKPG
jgi:hypothetical protein